MRDYIESLYKLDFSNFDYDKYYFGLRYLGNRYLLSKLDELNLDSIIKNYIGNLTEDGVIETSSEFIDKDGEEEVKLSEKELELLKMLHKRDIDVDTAIALLHVSEKDLEYMTRKLLTLEMLQYISSDEVELTEMGIAYMKAKEKEKEEVKQKIKVANS